MDSNVNASLKFTFCMQAWGIRYTKIFLELGLPSQLVAGNLLNFPWLNNSTYEIFTTEVDKQIMEASEVFNKLKNIIKVNFIFIDDLVKMHNDAKWKLVRHCHQTSAKLGDSRDSAVFYLHPDQMWTQGSFYNAAKKIADGYSAVLCPGPRLVEEDVIPLLKQNFVESTWSMPLPARKFIAMGMKNLHPETKLWHWDQKNFFKLSTYLFYSVPDEGMSAFCFALHPVVMKPEVKFAPFNKIFDQDYLASACPDFSKIYIARDSDEVFHFELSSKDIQIPYYPYHWIDPIKLLAWYTEFNYTWQQRLSVKLPIRIHYTDIDAEKWTQYELQGHETIAKLEKWWKIEDFQLAAKHPEHYIARFNGKYKFISSKEIPTKDKTLKYFANFMSKFFYVAICRSKFFGGAKISIFLLRVLKKIRVVNKNIWAQL